MKPIGVAHLAAFLLYWTVGLLGPLTSWFPEALQSLFLLPAFLLLSSKKELTSPITPTRSGLLVCLAILVGLVTLGAIIHFVGNRVEFPYSAKLVISLSLWLLGVFVGFRTVRKTGRDEIDRLSAGREGE